MKIAICDDDLSTLNYIERCIAKLSIKGLEWDAFSSGSELTNYLAKHNSSYNIYLLDIEMPGQNGIDTASFIRKNDSDALIIFITSHKEYVYQVFEVLPFRFIQKPVKSEELMITLHDAIEHIGVSNQYFFFNIGHEQYQLPYHDIMYFESSGRKIILHTPIETYEIYGKISNIYGSLNKNLFCQTHASFLVNMNFIRSIRQTELILMDHTSIPISKRHKHEIRQAHLSFMEWRSGKT